jgi:nucleotide-binding universal stress UspA family protein
MFKEKKAMSWTVRKPILVPFDFSEHSHVAVDKAIELADSPSQIHILHILPTYVPLAPEGFPIEAIDDQLRIDIAKKAIAKEFDDPRYAGTVREVAVGDPGISCVERSEEIDAELIVIASHGRSGISRLLLGSVAERILRHAKCPVLVMKIT